MKKRENLYMLILSALIAAGLLLLFSRSSPLYPTNNWGEANAFFTMGRGMLAGKVPYHDLSLNAGPVVYALHALAALISSGSFLGVWLLEIIALAASIFFAWKAANRISGMPVLSMACSALAALLLVSGRAFIYGDTIEEFALPLQMFALCDLLRYLDDPERRMSTWRLALHGFLAGCVFWMKYSLAGIHLVFIAAIAIDEMVRQWEMKGAICMCLEFAVGMLFATAPWVVYFKLNNALSVFLHTYFDINLSSLAYEFSPVRDAFLGLASGALQNPMAALAVLCGAGYLLYRLVHRRWNAGCTAVVAAFVCAAIFAYVEGERWRYSPLAIAAFLMLAAGPFALLVRYAWRQRKVYAALLGCAALACAGYACMENENLPFVGYPEEKLPQQIFAEYIEANGGGSVLTYEMCDHGFYLATDTLPEAVAFARSKSYTDEYVYSMQDKFMSNGNVDWIITRNTHVGGNYMEVLNADSPYDRSTAEGKGVYRYRLYRRFEK